MVKLVTVRRARLYGPPHYRESFEMANAAVYFVATVLLLVGAAFQLPEFNNMLGLTLLLVGLLLMIAINLHDLHAQLAGIEFNTEVLQLDTQLALVEVAAPVVYALGSVLLFVGVLFLLRISPGKHYFWLSKRRRLNAHSMRLLCTGSLLWLVGSVLNNFQVYQRTPVYLQAYQKSVLVSFLLASTLYVFSTLLGMNTWPHQVADNIQGVAVWFSIVACGLLVLGAIMNIIRLIEIRQYERNGELLEPLRGGAQTTTEATAALIARPALDVPITTIVQPERLY